MSDLLTDIKLTLNELSINLDIYSERLAYVNFEGFDPKQYHYTIDVVKSLDKLYSKFKIPAKLPDRVKFYESLAEIIDVVGDLVKVYDGYDFGVDFGSSSSSNNSLKLIEDAWYNLIISYNKYVNIFENSKQDIVKHLCDGFKDEFISTIENVNMSLSSAPMIIFMLRSLDNPDEYIEKLKDRILIGGAKLPKIKITNAIQRLIQRMRLVPVGLSMPLRKLLETIEPGVKTLKDLCKLKSDHYRFGYIVIRRLLSMPHETNIWTLTNSKYLVQHDLMTGEEMGINDKMLRRFETIIPLESPVGKRVGNVVEVYNGLFKKDNYYYIFETLNDVDYRIMKSNFYLPGYPHAVPEFNIDDIPQARIEAYHKILEDKIIENVSDPIISIADSYSDINRRAGEIKWDIFRRRIKDSLIEWWENNAKVKSEGEFAKLIMSRVIKKHLSESIITAISLEDAKTISQLGDIHEKELQLSYAADLSSLLSRFEHIIEDTYSREYKKDLLSRKMTPSTFLNIFKKLIDDVIPSLINRKNNIYQQLIHKADILTKTISE